MPPSKARKPGKGNLYNKRKHKLKRRTKDLDQIHEDMKDKNAESLLKQEVDYDKPGSAQFYCLHCARYFIDQFAMTEHFRSRNHKKRLKALEESPYTQAEAEAAAGMGCYRPPKRQKVTTQPIIDKNV